MLGRISGIGKKMAERMVLELKSKIMSVAPESAYLSKVPDAAHATGEPRYGEALDRMIGFFCRIMARSRRYPQFDGGWYRGFDFGRWDFGGSNADRCWGPYCMETGWKQG